MASSRPDEHAVAAALLANEPRYKKFVLQIEKSLSTFENVHDWADCTAFLTRLLKSLQAFPQFKDVPCKSTISKRLAQCLNPALPTGVHQRALEVYSHIFLVLGSDGLRRDLQLWSTGLLPFFEYASTALKSVVLQLLESHYLPLLHHIRPLLRSIILALLPGLEEETGEYFEKVLNLLDSLRQIVSDAPFYQSIWLIMLSTPPARGAALNLLAKRLPRLQEEQEAFSITGRDIGLMVRSFSSAMEDENMLVRRSALDIAIRSLRMDSYLMQRAQHEDRMVLVGAAAGVVLRRDLSLNRRLYTWLLGPGESSENQILYFKKNSLQVLSDTLKRDLSSGVEAKKCSRALKIFTALLDKWELGSCLTDSLVCDAFFAVSHYQSDGGVNSEVLSSANALYDTMQPWAFWRQAFRAVHRELTISKQTGEGYRILQFVLNSFPTHDNETKLVHLPIIFSAISQVLGQQAGIPSNRSELIETVNLLRSMIAHLSRQTLEGSAEISTDKVEQRPSDCLSQACLLYGVEAKNSRCAEGVRLPTIFQVAFDAAVSVIEACFHRQSPHSDPTATQFSKELFTPSVMLVISLLRNMDISENTKLYIAWNPGNVLASLMKCIHDFSFSELSLTLDFCMLVNQTTTAATPFPIGNSCNICKLFLALIQFLRAEEAQNHLSAVNYVWKVQTMAKHDELASVLGLLLSSDNSSYEMNDAYGAFGTLWRHSDDASAPSACLSVPLFHVLGTLTSALPATRQLGESWMRAYPKSYLRILDALLFELVNSTVPLKDIAFEYNGHVIEGKLYIRTMDQHRFAYFLELALALMRFGGATILKSCSSTLLVRSNHPQLLSSLKRSDILRARHALPADYSASSYMDLILEIVKRALQAQPERDAAARHREDAGNTTIQSFSSEILQFIVSRCELDNSQLEDLETVIVHKLYWSVQEKHWQLQAQLLHLLHTIIYASSAKKVHPLAHSTLSRRSEPETPRYDAAEQPDNLIAASVNPGSTVYALTIQTLKDGLAQSFMSHLYQYWLDFTVVSLSVMRPTSSIHILELMQCLCHQVDRALQDMASFKSARTSPSGFHSAVNELDFVMLLNALERLCVLVTPGASDNYGEEALATPLDRTAAASDTGGIFGLVSNVFGSVPMDSGTADNDWNRSPGYQVLVDCISSLYKVWKATAPQVVSIPAVTDSFTLVANKTWNKCRKTLEHIFRIRPSDSFAILVDQWFTAGYPSSSEIYDLVDILTSNPQEVLQLTIDAIMQSLETQKIIAQGRRSALPLALFSFLEGYFTRMEANLVPQLWGQFSTLAKDVLAHFQDNRTHLLYSLKCAIVLGDKLAQTSALDGKKLRKEYQEIFLRLLDSCAILSAKLTNHARPKLKDSGKGGRSSPMPSSNAIIPEKRDEELEVAVSELDATADMVTMCIATGAIQTLQKTVLDGDRVTTACTNICYYIVTPAIRNKSGRQFEVREPVMKVLQQITSVPNSARAWRGTVQEAFHDQKFFEMSPESGRQWSEVIRALQSTDKQALPELVSRISAAPSGNIFANRENEIATRVAAFRRVSYAVFVGEKDGALNHLPIIQEKLAETLRNGISPLIQAEAYLCIRILLCRLSPHNLSGIWPVMIADLLQLFTQLLKEAPAEGSDDLRLVLSVCKFLDTALTVQTNEFQIHQWMFITDTVDAVYPPEEWRPAALLDRLSEVVSDLPLRTTKHAEDPRHALGERNVPKLRKPLLTELDHISGIVQLGFFFSHASLACYEGLYASRGHIDWPAVEWSLLKDLFSGR